MVCELYLNKAIAEICVCIYNTNQKARVAVLIVYKLELEANVMLIPKPDKKKGPFCL